MDAQQIIARLQQIEARLYGLMPARTKTDVPIVFEDYVGAVGEQKNREWDELMREKRELEEKLVGGSHG